MGEYTCKNCGYYVKRPAEVMEKCSNDGVCLKLGKSVKGSTEGFHCPCDSPYNFFDAENAMYWKPFDLKTWLKRIYDVCIDRMEGCSEPEWSLYSGIADVIANYLNGKSGYTVCNPFNHNDCPVLKKMEQSSHTK